MQEEYVFTCDLERIWAELTPTERRQVEVLGDVGVLDVHGVFDSLSFQDFGRVRRTRDRRPAAEGFEHGLLDHSVIVHFYLKLHDVSTCWCSNKASANSGVLFIH